MGRGDGVSPTVARTFPVVGVGASAGGLEAFTQLLKALPDDTGMAFVLVQHLDPKHESLLVELLSRATSMPVMQASEGVAVRPNRTYVIPPNVDMAIENGTLHLMPRSEVRGQHMPIDAFFHSLALDQQGQAIGVILSGTASDGAHGMAAIKAAGGITFAQEERSAKYGSMPHSAIAGGAVDFILSPEKIAVELARIGRHPYVRAAAGEVEEIPAESEGTLGKIFLQLRNASGVDFSLYKQNTIKRRIKRRMVLHRIDRLDEYLSYLHSRPGEIRALYDDMLVNVTRFFRDPEMFDALKRIVLPSVMKHNDEGFRAWVPGCSTGEEAYSIAICLCEALGDRSASSPIQIFATDIGDSAIEIARAGIYRESIASDVSPERLRRFFVKTDGGYQVSKAVRDVCIFAKQDVTKDPPFSRLDLISCRNVLIYLGPVLQKQVMPIFHYALKPTGYLMLGNSESIGGFSDLLQLVDRKNKIYSKKPVPVRASFGLPYAAGLPAAEGLRPHLSEAVRREHDVQREADRMLLARYAPAGVLVNQETEIIQFRGHTGAYLEPSPGQASLNLLRMAREGLGLEIRAAVHKAKKTRRPVVKEGIQYFYNGEERSVDIEVIPLTISSLSSAQPFFMIMFNSPPEPPRAARKARRGFRGAEARAEKNEVSRLRKELAATKEYLQSNVEDQEATNEELTSANEEILSSNEELQSTNEELETAKEELQSSNEELTTVNEELQNRNLELSQLNNDLTNVLASVNVPIVILGPDLRIRRFTPAAETILNLIAGDVGRRITDIKPTIQVPELPTLLREVIDTATTREATVQDTDGRSFSLRIRPYRTLDNRIDGAVLILVDIDVLTRNMKELRAAQDYADAIVETVLEAVLILDGDLRVQRANRAFYDLFQVTPEQILNRGILELGEGQWNILRFLEALRDVASGKESVEGLELEVEIPSIGRKSLLVSMRRLDLETTTGLVLCAIADVTERESALKAVSDLSGRLIRLRDEEQRRIARELHDATAQNLTALAMNLALILESRASLAPDKQKLAKESVDLAEQCARELRDIAALLHPPLLDEVGLVEAVKWFTGSFSRRTGIRVKLDGSKKIGRLPEEIETALFRIVQESLNNIQRHSGSHTAAIKFERIDDVVKVQISDQGRGLPSGTAKSGLGLTTLGLGVAGMRERTKKLGGLFTIHTGNGTTVEVRIPVVEENS